MTDDAPVQHNKRTDSSPPFNNNDAARKDELVFNLITKQYDYQSQRKRDLDSKAGSLIGYVTIVTGLLIGLGTFSILGSLSKPQFYLPYFIGIASLIASIVFSLLAIRIRKWTAVPAVRKLFDSAMKGHNATQFDSLLSDLSPFLWCQSTTFYTPLQSAHL